MEAFFEKKMRFEISSFIFTWRGYMKRRNPQTLINLKEKLDKTRQRYTDKKQIDIFEHHFAIMQYEKGVKIVFD